MLDEENLPASKGQKKNPKEQSSINQKLCKYCCEKINCNAIVCKHCSRHQKWFVQHFDRLGIVISFFILVASVWQFNEARKERSAAEKALERAQVVEIQMKKAGASFSKALLAISRYNGTVGSFKMMSFSSPFLKLQADELIDALNMTKEEEYKAYRFYKACGEYLALPEGSDEKKKALEEIKLLAEQTFEK